MTDKAVKVGDVVAWDDVPRGSMVEWTWSYHPKQHYIKRNNGSAILYDEGKWVDAKHLNGDFKSSHLVTVLAIGLTGNETADDLRALAEAFEREHPTRDA